MGKITVAMYITLDGVMETPFWTGPYWEDQLSDYQDKAQKEATALLLGRVTFEQFAKAWPESPDPGAPFMNGVGKFVPTTTLKDAYWKAEFIHEDVVERLKALKQEHNMLVYGSAGLTRFLFQNDLVDEYREMVFPIILGQGKKLFDQTSIATTRKFSRVDSAKTAKQVLLNTYTR